MSLLAGSSVLAGVAVQRDEALSWRYQRTLWKEVIELCPDIRAGQVILLDGRDQLPEARHLQVFEWHMYLVMASVYQTPAFSRAPELWTVKPEWRRSLNADGLVLGTDVLEKPLPRMPERRVDVADLIILAVQNGRLQRQNPTGPATRLQRGILYATLVAP